MDAPFTPTQPGDRQPGGPARFASPAEFPDSPLSRALRQPVLLGLFLPIQAGGWSSSTLPRTTTWTFDYNKALTLKAEALGFDLIFGLSQWLPKGGYGDVLNGQALDSFVALAALTAVTSRVLLISTVHVLYGPWHPLHLAKFGATLDHISGGRWGMNVVTGHRAVEHEMFGWTRIEHDRRYELATELLEAVQSLWTETDAVSYVGQADWRLNQGFVTPKPLYGRPILVNATGSAAGIAFAGRHSDIVFVTSPGGTTFDHAVTSLPAHTAWVKQAAVNVGRRVRTLLNPMVICRDTEREAWAYHDAIVDHVDRSSPAAFGTFNSDAEAWKAQEDRGSVAARAVGGNIRLIASPEQIVDQFVALRHAGVDGLQLSFFDFQPDLEHFGERVLPLMKKAGLRL